MTRYDSAVRSVFTHADLRLEVPGLLRDFFGRHADKCLMALSVQRTEEWALDELDKITTPLGIARETCVALFPPTHQLQRFIAGRLINVASTVSKEAEFNASMVVDWMVSVMHAEHLGISDPDVHIPWPISENVQSTLKVETVTHMMEHMIIRAPDTARFKISDEEKITCAAIRSVFGVNSKSVQWFNHDPLCNIDNANKGRSDQSAERSSSSATPGPTDNNNRYFESLEHALMQAMRAVNEDTSREDEDVANANDLEAAANSGRLLHVEVTSFVMQPGVYLRAVASMLLFYLRDPSFSYPIAQTRDYTGLRSFIAKLWALSHAPDLQRQWMFMTTRTPDQSAHTRINPATGMCDTESAQQKLRRAIYDVQVHPIFRRSWIVIPAVRLWILSFMALQCRTLCDYINLTSSKRFVHLFEVAIAHAVQMRDLFFASGAGAMARRDLETERKLTADIKQTTMSFTQTMTTILRPGAFLSSLARRKAVRDLITDVKEHELRGLPVVPVTDPPETLEDAMTVFFPFRANSGTTRAAAVAAPVVSTLSDDDNDDEDEDATDDSSVDEDYKDDRSLLASYMALTQRQRPDTKISRADNVQVCAQLKSGIPPYLFNWAAQVINARLLTSVNCHETTARMVGVEKLAAITAGSELQNDGRHLLDDTDEDERTAINGSHVDKDTAERGVPTHCHLSFLQNYRLCMAAINALGQVPGPDLLPSETMQLQKRNLTRLLREFYLDRLISSRFSTALDDIAHHTPRLLNILAVLTDVSNSVHRSYFVDALPPRWADSFHASLVRCKVPTADIAEVLDNFMLTSIAWCPSCGRVGSLLAKSIHTLALTDKVRNPKADEYDYHRLIRGVPLNIKRGVPISICMPPPARGPARIAVDISSLGEVDDKGVPQLPQSCCNRKRVAGSDRCRVTPTAWDDIVRSVSVIENHVYMPCSEPGCGRLFAYCRDYVFSGPFGLRCAVCGVYHESVFMMSTEKKTRRSNRGPKTRISVRRRGGKITRVGGGADEEDDDN